IEPSAMIEMSPVAGLDIFISIHIFCVSTSEVATAARLRKTAPPVPSKLPDSILMSPPVFSVLPGPPFSVPVIFSEAASLASTPQPTDTSTVAAARAAREVRMRERAIWGFLRGGTWRRKAERLRHQVHGSYRSV